MRKLFDYLLVLLILLATNGLIHAQDFTVTISTTDACNHYITPIKAGGSHQFQIRVENNSSDTSTVSIDKDAMGADVSSWVTIDNNSQQLFPSQSKNFLLTINVPAGTCDCDFIMDLYFDAKDKDGDEHEFSYYSQYIIVDNSPPSSPTFTVSQTSKTIFVGSWFSWDDRSSTYTAWNSEAGIGGIKTYKVDIIDPNGTTIVKSKTFDFSGSEYHTFDDLNSNTNYKARVTAIDLVGNSKATEKSATTAPANPTGLTFSNITYTDATLSWTPTAGATAYDVYKVTGTANTKLNSSPVQGNSYIIGNLNPNTTYKFNIIALSNVGPSERSNNASVTTLALPSIIGSSTTCSSSNSTYTLNNQLPGNTVTWSKSSNLSYVSHNTNSYTVTTSSTLKEWAWVQAEISIPNWGPIIILKNIWIGSPSVQIVGLSELAMYSSSTYTASRNYGCHVDSYLWNIMMSPLAFSYFSNDNKSYEIETLGTAGIFRLRLTATNNCGSQISTKFIEVLSSGGGGGVPRSVEVPLLTVFPNPANTNIEINIQDEKLSSDNNLIFKTTLFNNQSVPVYKKNFKNNVFNIDVSGFSNGIYLLQVICNGQKYSAQIIIEH